jgi:hypothetical protein
MSKVKMSNKQHALNFYAPLGRFNRQESGVVAAMKAMLYIPNKPDPVAIFDEVEIIQFNQSNHDAPYRITFKSPRLNAGKTTVEMERDRKMTLKLEDGRTCSVLLQHTSLDSKGNAVGVLRVLGDFVN